MHSDRYSRVAAYTRLYCVSLNALSGIGCIRTELYRAEGGVIKVRLNALSGIGCIRTEMTASDFMRNGLRLNALSGIGCIRPQEEQEQ